jgi:tRNA modification GTPase
MNTEKETICAIATAPGMGAIAVIRVSGPDTFTYCDRLFRAASKGKTLGSTPSHTALFGRVFLEETLIDEVVATVFKGPHSFTGEDTVELSCHGSTYVQQTLLHALLRVGCRMARPGEFSQRAFLNGKMDLSQAEAVADLIASTSEAAHRLALQQMRGGFSRELETLRAGLLHFVTMVELELDFSEEEVEFADRHALIELVEQMEQHLHRLMDTFRLGNALKNGIPVALVGETNAGKSTLLNTLLHEEKAIVSDIHGTTRDFIEDTMVIEGVTFRFIDTAGLRQHTTDQIERMGMERTYGKMEQASIVLWVIDSTHVADHTEWIGSRIRALGDEKNVLLVFNKSDKLTPDAQEALLRQFESFPAKRVFISAKHNEHIDALKSALLETAALPDLQHQDLIVTNLRHYEALALAHEAIARVQRGLQEKLSGDFLSQDIRECLHHLGQITGLITNDEVLANIFKNFCIGK